MDWQQSLNGFDLHHNLALNKEVKAISTIKGNTFVGDGKIYLAFKRQALQA